MSESDLGNKKCFVIMPFGSRKKEFPEWREYYDTSITEHGHWLNIYENIIKKAVEDSGYQLKCFRVDEEKGPNDWDDEIVKHMIEDYMAIIDISVINTNVYWELGVRHALGNRNIIITSDRSKQASDITGQKSFLYSLKDSRVKSDFFNDVKKSIASIIKEPNKRRNRVQKNLQFSESKIKTALQKKYGRQELAVAGFTERLENIKRILQYRKILPAIKGLNGFIACRIEENVLYKNDRKMIHSSLTNFPSVHNQISNLYFMHNVLFGSIEWNNIKTKVLGIMREVQDRKFIENCVFIIPVLEKSENYQKIINDFYKFITANYGGSPRGFAFEIWDPNIIAAMEKAYFLD